MLRSWKVTGGATPMEMLLDLLFDSSRTLRLSPIPLCLERQTEKGIKAKDLLFRVKGVCIDGDRFIFIIWGWPDGGTARHYYLVETYPDRPLPKRVYQVRSETVQQLLPRRS